jgi:homoserine O-acetyltransferase
LTNEGRGFALEGGGWLPEVTVAFETWGTLNEAHSNAILIEHALTGDSHATGPAGPGHPTPGWWDGLIGPGASIDTDEYFVVCPNVLGGCQGTTGPSSVRPDGTRYGSSFPLITIRDQVVVEVAFANELGIERWASVIGGSMGGMRALEWCVGFADRVDSAVVLAVGAAASADQIALCSIQARAIRGDAAYAKGDYYDIGERPTGGLALARAVGQVSYRTGEELDARFGRRDQDGEEPLLGGRYAIESYLEYHGGKLADRFDPNSYVVLSEAMNHHDIGRGRGGIQNALSRVSAMLTLAGVNTDRLYPIGQQWEIADDLPGETAVQVIKSVSGHDGFLSEFEQVGTIIRRALDEYGARVNGSSRSDVVSR